MTQEIFPEIHTATQAIEARIALTEREIVQLKEEIQTRKELLRSCRKALRAFNPRGAQQKKKAA